MRRIFSGLIVVFISVNLLVACTPKAVPVRPPELAPEMTPAKPALSAPTTIPEDTAWAKVVEAAQKEGTLNFYSGGSWGGDEYLALVGAFKAKYGISVEGITGMAKDSLERLKTEKRMGKMVGDVFTTTPSIVLEAKRSDLTVSLADLPVFQEKNVWAVDIAVGDSDKHIPAYYVSHMVSWANTKMMPSGDQPRSLKDLLLPRWSGQIITTDPTTHAGLYIIFVTYINRGIVDWNYVKQLGKQNMKMPPSTDKAALMLAQGEAPFLLNGPDSIVNPMAKAGAPIRPVPLQEGTVVQLPFISVIKGAPHPNAAKLFVNWILTQEGQQIVGRAKGLPSVRKDVPDQTPTAARFTPISRLLITSEEYDLITKHNLDRTIVKLWKE